MKNKEMADLLQKTKSSLEQNINKEIFEIEAVSNLSETSSGIYLTNSIDVKIVTILMIFFRFTQQ